MARTPITDERLSKAVAEFTRPRFDGKSYLDLRREQFDPKARGILRLLETPDNLSELDARRIYRETPVDGPRLHLRDFMANGLLKISRALNYLLHSPEPLQKRFY